MTKKRLAGAIGLLLLMPLAAFGQFSSALDDILEQSELQCGQAAYLALNAAGAAGETIEPQAAWAQIQEYDWFSSDKQATDSVSLGEYSLMLMQLFEIPGGIMYSLFPSARYASRELGFLGIIPQNAGAYRTLDGSEAVSILGQVLQHQKEQNQ